MSCRIAVRRVVLCTSRITHQARLQSQASAPSSSKQSIEDMLSKPTQSIRTLLEPSSKADSIEKVTPSQLHHLLRLAALPLPASKAEEDKMLETLQRQLHFVRALQEVDTKGVEPLRVIRDETAQGVAESMIGLKDLQEVLDKEEKIGFYQRPRRMREKQEKESEAEKWDALGMGGEESGQIFCCGEWEERRGELTENERVYVCMVYDSIVGLLCTRPKLLLGKK